MFRFQWDICTYITCTHRLYLYVCSDFNGIFVHILHVHIDYTCMCVQISMGYLYIHHMYTTHRLYLYMFGFQWDICTYITCTRAGQEIIADHWTFSNHLK